MRLMERFLGQAVRRRGTIVFPEGDDGRTAEAASRLARDGVCRVVLVKAGRAGGPETVAPDRSLLDPGVLEGFVASRRRRGLSAEEALELALRPLYFGALYVRSGRADGCVAGARSSTQEVLRAAIRGIGAADGVRLVSSFFLMLPPAGHPLAGRPLIFADCAVNPSPDAAALRDIAASSIGSCRTLFPERSPVRVAFLSFSTKGSGSSPVLGPVRDAAAATAALFRDDPSVLCDGELQFDAAVVPDVAARKAPSSPVRGMADILVFPDLNAGNICYKAVERLGGFAAVGPMVQGLRHPMNDLSRGASADDIYRTAVMTLVQAGGGMPGRKP